MYGPEYQQAGSVLKFTNIWSYLYYDWCNYKRGIELYLVASDRCRWGGFCNLSVICSYSICMPIFFEKKQELVSYTYQKVYLSKDLSMIRKLIRAISPPQTSEGIRNNKSELYK